MRRRIRLYLQPQKVTIRRASHNELELFTALQRRGVPSKLLYFPDEGHWVLKPQNSKLWYQTVGDWFDQYLKAPSP